MLKLKELARNNEYFMLLNTETHEIGIFRPEIVSDSMIKDIDSGDFYEWSEFQIDETEINSFANLFELARQNIREFNEITRRNPDDN